MKKFDEYQKFTDSTATYRHIKGLAYPVLGLNGEAGEVAEKVKKVLRDKNGRLSMQDKKAIAFELGDVLWYLSQTAKGIGMKLSEIAELNVMKLKDRKARGKIRGSGDER